MRKGTGNLHKPTNTPGNSAAFVKEMERKNAANKKERELAIAAQRDEKYDLLRNKLEA